MTVDNFGPDQANSEDNISFAMFLLSDQLQDSNKTLYHSLLVALKLHIVYTVALKLPAQHGILFTVLQNNANTVGLVLIVML